MVRGYPPPYSSLSKMSLDDLFGACKRGDIARVRQAVANGVDVRKVVDKSNSNYTPLLYACVYGHLPLVKYLVEDLKCSTISLAGALRETPLHTACRIGRLPLVKYLVEDRKCSVTCTSAGGRTPLHEACWEGHLGIAKVLISSEQCNLEAVDNNGETPLHLAVRWGHTAVAAFLLQEGQCNPNCVTHDGKTPLDMTNDPELIRLFLNSGAIPTSTDMAIKMFVLGNPAAGKSTFVKALSTEGEGQFSRIKHQFTKVKDVDEKTAGIIPHDIHSKILGHLTLYDFAGHKEYYAGHDALLHNTMTNSPSIITLVVDMRDEEGKIRETLQYWFQFINNHSSDGGAKPHLLIIGSHADKISSSEKKQRSQVLELVVNSYKFDSVTFAGQIITDCRYAESSSMTKLRSMLSEICQALRSTGKMAITHQRFLVFLLHRFRDRLAVTYSNATEELRHKLNSDNRSYAYLEYIKYSNHFVTCERLNEHGNILFMKNKENPENSWIVLDKAVLLSQVNGVIFAPEGFKEHQKSLSTSTGVVPLSKLAPLFPNINPDMITQFLCHLEFCQEIKELELASLLATEGQSSPTAGERYFFFPGLVHLDTPQDVIESTASKLDYNSGWVLQCSKSEQFFSSRFLQVLLLRLAFLFALAPTDPSTTDHLALRRKCSVWKNGIYWVNRSGGEAIVEIINLRQVVVIVRSKLKKMELVRLRSAVINTVISTKEEFCSKVLVKESLILPEDAVAVYPLDPSKMTGVSITEVAATITEGKEFAIYGNNQTVELEKLIYFEPYAYLGEPLLQRLFSEDGTEAQEITDELLNDIVIKCSRKNIDKYCAIFVQKVDECASHGGVCRLLQLFQLWRDKMGKEGTQKNFKKKLDQFSVLAGRNPLKLIIGGTPSAVASSSTNPAGHVDQHSSQYHESDSATVSSTAHGNETENQEDYHDRNSVIPKIGDQPQLHELQLLKGVDGRTVRVMERVAPDWKHLAISLKFDLWKIKTIEKDYKTSTEEACQEMFMRWLAGEHDLTQPCTWNTLINCLRHAAFIDLANSLRTSLRQ